MQDVSLIEGLGLLGLILIAGGIFCVIFWAVMWWVIFKKAGFSYSFLLGILMAVPLINIVLFLIFAFGEWPILKNK